MYGLRCIVLFIFYGFIGLTTNAQEDKFITGKLVDSITLEPVVFATVKIKDKALGVISNADGSFKIPVKYRNRGEYLEISSMGYTTVVISLKDFTENQIKSIKMQAAYLELDEVIVNEKRIRRPKLSAKRIIHKSIENLTKNLPEKPYSYVGYYRDYQLNKNNNYSNLNEAILQIYDQGNQFLDSETSKVRVLRYGSENNFPVEAFAQIPYNYKSKRKTISNAFLNSYGGNEYTILRIHDPIRNNKINSFDFVNVFERDFAVNHNFTKEQDVVVDGIFLYHISFSPNYNEISIKDKLQIKGHIYITKDNFAIQGFEYAIYDKNSIKNRVDVDGLLFKTKVEYALNNGKMFLSYHSMDNTFIISNDPKLKIENFTLNLERNCFTLKFNNPLEENSAIRSSNYDIRFNGDKIILKDVILISNEVLLIPNLENKNTEEMFREIILLGEQRKINNNNLKIELKKIKDIEGNEINVSEYETRKQFREFFVQKLQLDANVLPNDTTLMNMRKPIFDELQPIYKDDASDDYWMNTPLPNIHN